MHAGTFSAKPVVSKGCCVSRESGCVVTEAAACAMPAQYRATAAMTNSRIFGRWRTHEWKREAPVLRGRRITEANDDSRLQNNTGLQAAPETRIHCRQALTIPRRYFWSLVKAVRPG